MGALSQLKGLEPKSEDALNAIDIFTRDDLNKYGAIRAFLALKQSNPKTSLNFLYAMVGALEDKHWIDIAQSDKGRLLMELEDFQELEALLKQDGIALDL